jgi:trimeric autotransporter adhesin
MRPLNPHLPASTRRLKSRNRAAARPLGCLPSRGRIVAMVALAAALLTLASGAAYAYFMATVEAGSSGGAVAASLPRGSTPEVSLSGTSVTVSWAQSSVGGQRLGAYAGGGYTLKRYPASGGSGVTPGASCDTTIGGASEKLSCTESNIPPGSWRYTVTPVLNNWVGSESAQSAAVTIVGPPAKIAVQSGSPQSATVKTPFENALVALVTDAGGNPVPGVLVTFTAPSSGASGTFENGTASTTATTASNGRATAGAFTANTIAGGYTVSASVSGVSASAGFALTNNPGAASKLAFTTEPSSTATKNSAFATQPVVTVEDTFGNTVGTDGSSVTLALKSNPEKASLACTANTLTASGGIASFAGCKINKDGTFSLHAADGALTAADSTSIVVTG